MARDRELDYVMSLRDDATAAYRKFVGEVEKGTTSINSLAKSAGGALAAMFTVETAAEFIKMAAEADANVASLDAALKSAGYSGAEYQKTLLEQADALKQKTAVDDDEIIRLQKLVLAYTGNIDVTKQLVPAILDVSRATGMSTDAAARLFARTQEGSEGLKRLGITVGNTVTEEQRLGKILDQVREKFGGQAEAFAKTDLGKIEQSKIAWEDFGKSVGRLLSSVFMPLVPTLTDISNGVANMTDNVRGFFQEMENHGLDNFKKEQSALARTLGETAGTVRENVAALSPHLATAANSTRDLSRSTADNTLEFLKATGQTDAYWAMVNKLLGAHTNVAAGTKNTTTTTRTFNEQLDALQEQLKGMDPTSQQYINTLAQIDTMQNRVALSAERAKMKSQGIGGTTQMDVKFSMGFKSELDNAAAAADKFFSDFQKKAKKMFGGNVTAEQVQNAQDTANIIEELRVKSFGEGKQKELALLSDWETNAVAMAHGREDLITQITATAAAERAKIEQQYSVQTFQAAAGYAQQAIGLIEQALANKSQGIINMLEHQRDGELKGLDKETAAVKRKYDVMLRNQNLTAEQRETIRQEEAAEEEKLAARKQAVEDAYNEKIRAEKVRAFEANKRAQLISAAINTAVEITKVIATPWMVPIVAGLGLAQAAIIASQPTPSFHTGGSGTFNAPPSSETMVKIRGGETIDVYTPEQRDARAGGGAINFYFNNYAPVADDEFIINAFRKFVRSTGLPLGRIIINDRDAVTLGG